MYNGLRQYGYETGVVIRAEFLIREIARFTPTALQRQMRCSCSSFSGTFIPRFSM